MTSSGAIIRPACDCDSDRTPVRPSRHARPPAGIRWMPAGCLRQDAYIPVSRAIIARHRAPGISGGYPPRAPVAGQDCGGPTGNRTRVQGFAVLCVTTPPSGLDALGVAQMLRFCVAVNHRCLAVGGAIRGGWQIHALFLSVAARHCGLTFAARGDVFHRPLARDDGAPPVSRSASIRRHPRRCARDGAARDQRGVGGGGRGC